MVCCSYVGSSICIVLVGIKTCTVEALITSSHLHLSVLLVLQLLMRLNRSFSQSLRAFPGEALEGHAGFLGPHKVTSLVSGPKNVIDSCVSLF